MSSRLRTSTLVLVGVVLALVLAGVVSFYASGSPDGLNKVAADKGFDKQEKAHQLEDSPFAGYGTEGIDNERLSGGLAGVVGVAVTFVVVGALVLVVRRRQADVPDDGQDREADERAATGSRG
jgi:hypothetical protein